MASRELPGLGLNGFWNLGEDGWKPGTDENWLTLSVTVQLSVASRVTALPGSPTDGDIYIAPTGDPNEGKIAVRDDGEWVYIEPRQGWIAYVDDEAAHYTFTGTTWIALVTSGGGGGTDDQTAAEVPYDGGTSGPTNVQDALDLLVGALALDPAFFFSGGTADADRRVTYVATRAFGLPVSLTDSQTYAATPAGATVDFDVQKNGSSIGTISFASAANTATFTFASAVSFAAGDRLSVVAPSDLDTLAEVSITLKGVRAA